MGEADQKGPHAGRATGPGEAPGSDPLAPQTAQKVSAGGSIDVQAYIGARLRKAFDDVAQQPVPDRFLQLMRELDEG